MKRKALGIILIILSLCIVSYMPAKEYIDSRRRADIARKLDEATKQKTDEQKASLLKNARAYNAKLGKEPVHLDDGGGILDYEDQLSIMQGRDLSFATLYIPKLDLTMPIYHGIGKSALQQGVGHIPESSLPVGGNSSHTILGAHTGMTGMQAFDNIRKLEHDDLIGVKVLDKWYVYKVTYSEVVEPSDTRSIQIVKSRELLSLVTCTPYGINSHRLVVHARRVTTYDNFDRDDKKDISKLLLTVTGWPMLLAIGIILLVMTVTVIRNEYGKRRKRRIEKINEVGFGASIYARESGKKEEPRDKGEEKGDKHT